jgi:hypothetical protein
MMTPIRTGILVLLLPLLTLLFLVGCESDTLLSSNGDPVATADALDKKGRGGNGDFEVWVVDQSNAPGKTYGGLIHIFEGVELIGKAARKAEPIATIDIAGATADLCMGSTQVNPVRPHMIAFNSTRTHAILAFVGSGHVVIYDTNSREPVSCIRMSPGAGGAIQAHAAIPSSDDSFILVANQNGKLLERINTDYGSNNFVRDDAAQLSLYEGLTPNGVARELAAVRPDNAPICPILDDTGSLGFVTLRGGGLFVVDPTQTPMSIVGEYDQTQIKGNGCGGIQAGGYMFVNSGGGTAANLHSFELYRFPLSGYTPSNPQNAPARDLLFADNTEPRDSHGMVVTADERHLWVFDRGASTAEIFDVNSGNRLSTLDFGSTPDGRITPDLGAIAPAGNRIFASLRGPNPLTGDPHVATGAVPGIGVIRLTQNGRSGAIESVIPISNLDSGVERGDAHGIGVRVR